jgi:hypothetical protein
VTLNRNPLGLASFLGDKEVRTLKLMSQENSPEKCCLLANGQSTGTGGGQEESQELGSQRKNDSLL